MKIVIRTLKARVLKFSSSISDDYELIYIPNEFTDDEILEYAKDAEAIVVDSDITISGFLISNMPNLKIIQTEGVGYDKIDLHEALKHGVYVCNNRAFHSRSVAEHTIMFILMALRYGVRGNNMVLEERQRESKIMWNLLGIDELYLKDVFLFGMNHSALEVISLLKNFHCNIYYYSDKRLNESDELEYGVKYVDIVKGLCMDIISIHIEDDRYLLNSSIFSHMNKCILINTEMGHLVNNEDLIKAIRNDNIKVYATDTLCPEPVKLDNPLLLCEDIKDKLILSPHISGSTTDCYKKMYEFLWSNIDRVRKGESPFNIVNGLK